MSTVENRKLVFEVGATGVDTVQSFDAYRLPSSVRLWAYECGQVVVETPGKVSLADAVQISQRCRDVAARTPSVNPLLCDYELRPRSRLAYAGGSTSRVSVSRVGFVRVPDYFNLKIYDDGDVVILTGGRASSDRLAGVIAACEKAGLEKLADLRDTGEGERNG